MIYILLDNYDEGLELSEVKDFEALGEYLTKIREDEGGYSRIETIIFGEEVPWEVVSEYYKLESKR